MKQFLVFSLILTLCACATTPPETAPSAVAQLNAVLEREWSERLSANPWLATQYGVGFDGPPLGRVTPEHLAERDADNRALLDDLMAVDREALPRASQVDFDVMATILQDRVARYALQDYYFPFNADSGFHTALARLPAMQEFGGTEDYELYLTRLNDVPRYIDEHIDLLRRAINADMTQPRVILEGYDVTIASHVVDDVQTSVFWSPFDRIPTTVETSAHASLKQRGAAAIKSQVVPAFKRFLDFMNEEYVPQARTTLGASELPNGEAYYAAMIRSFTNLELTAKQIHDIGLSEVARIQAEMLNIIERVNFDGDLATFIQFLRTDPRFYAKTPKELLDRAKVISKDMDGELPRFFKRLPRKPYTVEPVPDHLAPKYTGGRYVPTSADSTRPGTYWVNTYALDSRPIYTQEALSFHEAVPGHHLQGALAAEMTDLKPFRRELYLSSFGEGWGLYSEWLGKEAGFYTDPYSDFGRLTYEMWRACRLVVDTGLHAFGWTREQAMNYMARHTALSIQEITTETDRYISWPGQALAYKLGELEIRALRKRAETELGARFDIREFHDRILRNGSVPLPVLRQEIDAYISEVNDHAG